MSGLLGVTGASGYIGEAVVRLASASGWRVVAVGRRPVAGADEWRLADLRFLPSTGLLNGLDAVLHLAANAEGGRASAESEIMFAHDLAAQAAKADIPFVFVSSQASAADAPSDYGRMKHVIEELVRPLGSVVVRPGMVVGGCESGLFGVLSRLVRRLPVIPDLLPRPMVQLIHVDDLAALLLAVCKHKEYAGRVLTAASSPVAFVDLLGGIARHWLRIRRVRVPVPLFLVRALLVAASLRGATRLSPTRLDSLVRLPMLQADPALGVLGITLRPLDSALDRRGKGVRSLLIEGRALARALTGTQPPPEMLRRYVCMLQALGSPDALRLPKSLLTRPAWLAALDAPFTRRNNVAHGSLAWRMNVMSRLAEAQPKLAYLYLVTSSRYGRFAAFADLANATVREIHSRLIRRWARYLARRVP